MQGPASQQSEAAAHSIDAAGMIGTGKAPMGANDGSAAVARKALGAIGPIPHAQLTAAMIEHVAADELSSQRQSDYVAGKENGFQLPLLPTSIADQMAQLNRNITEMRAAIKAMTGDSGKNGLNISATWEGKDPTSVTFAVPGDRENGLGQQRTVNILNERDERNVQSMANILTGSPNPMTYEQMHDFANIVKLYAGNDKALEKMYDNLMFEVKQRGVSESSVGLSYKGQKLDALMVYGRNKPTYFHLDGTISMRDPAEIVAKPPN
jgi:hypothetical protein